jgi:hypothetical protein
MTLQEMIDWDEFVRCYCIGQEDVMIMPYDPRKGYLSGEQYVHDPTYLSPELAARVGQDVLTLNRALGYDINTVEFAIKDGIPYAIDFMNPAPDAEVASVGEFYHNWLTKSVTDLVFRRLSEPRGATRYRWDALLNPEPVSQTATQAFAAAASVADSILPQSVRELPSEVVNSVTDFIGQATGVVSGIMDAVTDRRAGDDSQPDPQVAAHADDPQPEPRATAAGAAPKGAAARPRTATASKKGAAKGAAKRAASPRSTKKTPNEGPGEA